MNPYHQLRKRRAFALILTLCVLTLISIMVIGFIITSRFDRAISQGYANADRANLVAESAVDHAKALLASSIPDVGPNAPATPINWWVAPGRLWTQTANDTPKIYNLYSGDATAAADGPDLNRKKTDGTYPIEPSGKPMRVKWINVSEDPGQPVSASNPIVARFAYWIDVENTRVNLRYSKMGQGGKVSLTPTRLPFIPALDATTYFKGGDGFAGVGPACPYCSDLAVLANSSAITTSIWASGSPLRLSDVSEFREYFPSDVAWKSFYNANQFQISASGQSPEFSPFGISRMTTGLEGRNKLFAGYQYYWDLDNPSILPLGNFSLSGSNAPGGLPGTFYELEYVRAAVRQLANAFLSTEWPGYAGRSLASKWKARAGMPSADDAKFAEQVAWNLQGINTYQYREYRDMISLGIYGRAAAGTSSQPLFVNNLMPSTLKNPTNGRYFAQNGVPYVTEIGLCVEREAGADKPLYVSLVGELYVPPGIRSVDQADVKDKGITLGELPPFTSGSTDATYIIPSYVNFNVNGVKPSALPINKASGVVSNASNPITGYATAGSLTTNSARDRLGGLDGANGNYLVLSSTTASPDTRISVPVPGAPPSVKLDSIKLKVFAIRNPTDSTQMVVQYCPLYIADANAAGVLFPTPQAETISLGDITYTPGSGRQYYTVEVSDPRRSALSDAWANATTAGTATYPGKNTLGAANANWAGVPDISTPARHYGNPSGSTGYYPTNPDQKNYSFYTPGFCAALWTAPPYVVPATGDCYLNLTSSDTASPPDYLVLELLNTTSGLSSGNMQATVNINSGIFPSYFGIAPRTKAVEALLNRWSVGGSNVPASSIASTIAGRFNDPAFNGYPYRGAIIADLDFKPALTQLQRQSLIVTLAGRLTTQGTDFGVWGVAQTVKQTAGGDIIVQGERRFYSMVQAGPYPGVDGNLGNAKTDASGNFTESIAFGGKLYGSMRDSIDGPDAVPLPSYSNYLPPVDKSTPGSKLREAFNPLKPYMQFKTAYFKFLEP